MESMRTDILAEDKLVNYRGDHKMVKTPMSPDKSLPFESPPPIFLEILDFPLFISFQPFCLGMLVTFFYGLYNDFRYGVTTAPRSTGPQTMPF